jgi:hypothetical protein
MPIQGQHVFSHAYKEQVYAVWYSQGRPSANRLHALIQPDEGGDVPEPNTIVKWRTLEGWDDRADTTDIKISEKTDRQLVVMRMNMMRRHAEKAENIQQKAYEQIMDAGFDSSASAVSALFKAFDEEKKSRGMETALIKVFDMSDTELDKAMTRLMVKVSGIESEEESAEDGDVIDAVSETEVTDS